MHADQRLSSHQRRPPYLRLKQHSKPDLPRNQQHPTKRIRDSAAVDQSSARKKFDVLFVELFCKLSSAAIPSAQKTKKHRTENPIEVRSLLVIPTASKAFEKIHAVTSLVLKLLYESSKVFFSTITGG